MNLETFKNISLTKVFYVIGSGLGGFLLFPFLTWLSLQSFVPRGMVFFTFPSGMLLIWLTVGLIGIGAILLSVPLHVRETVFFLLFIALVLCSVLYGVGIIGIGYSWFLLGSLVLIGLSLPFGPLKHAPMTLLCAATALVTLIGGAFVAQDVRMHEFRELAERSDPVVEAVHQFEEDHDRPPNSLKALVPDYLDDVPTTGMAAYPDYEILTDTENRSYDFHGNNWVLRIYCFRGLLKFDQFIYFPNQNYPDTGWGGSLEKMGDWAYVHE